MWVGRDEADVFLLFFLLPLVSSHTHGVTVRGPPTIVVSLVELKQHFLEGAGLVGENFVLVSCAHTPMQRFEGIGAGRGNILDVILVSLIGEYAGYLGGGIQRGGL